MVQVETRIRDHFYFPLSVEVGVKSIVQRVTFRDIFYKLVKITPGTNTERNIQNRSAFS